MVSLPMDARSDELPVVHRSMATDDGADGDELPIVVGAL